MKTIEYQCKKRGDQLEFKQIGKKYSNNINKMVTRYLQKLNELKENIIKSKNPDEFLSYFNNNPCEICRKEKMNCISNKIFISPTQAYYRLLTFQNGIFGDVIRELEMSNMDVLIAGSSGIASVLKITDKFKGFEPKDMDFYIKNISDEKIRCFDDIIRKVFHEDKIIIVRRPLTLTWWIYDNYDNYKTEIQLNMLSVKSWSEVFVVHHSDLVCVGYDIRSKEFVTLTQRWNNLIQSYPHVWFSNLNSNENMDTLESSAKKYYNRGFDCLVIKVTKDIMKNYNQINLNVSDGINSTGMYNISIYDKLVVTYQKCQDIIISDTVHHLYDKFLFPEYIKMDTLTENDRFIKFILEYESPEGQECPIIMEKYNIGVANKNCKHDISLKAYILMKKIKECPICRAKFDPEICYRKRTGFIRKEKFIKYHDFTFKNVVSKELENIYNTKCEIFSYNINLIPCIKKCYCKDCVAKPIETKNSGNYNTTKSDESRVTYAPLQFAFPYEQPKIQLVEWRSQIRDLKDLNFNETERDNIRLVLPNVLTDMQGSATNNTSEQNIQSVEWGSEVWEEDDAYQDIETDDPETLPELESYDY